MKSNYEKIELKSEMNDSYGNVLESNTINNILTYLYGEPKTVSNLLNNLKLSPVKLQIYLNYLIETDIVELYEEENKEVIEKIYRLKPTKQNLDINVRINDDIALMNYADELSTTLRKSILTLKSGDLNDVSCYIGSVPQNILNNTIESIHKLQRDVEESEKAINEDVKFEKYMLITAFVPYKEDIQEDL